MNRFLKIIGNARLTIRQIGTLNALLYACDRTLKTLFTRSRIYRYIFVSQPVSLSTLTPPKRGTNIVVRSIGIGDAELSCMPPPPDVIKSRFDQGAICLGAFKDDLLTGYIWLCLGPYNEDEVRSRFIPKPCGQAAWDFDIYIMPEHRFGFTFPRLWDAANQHLQKNNINWTMSRISAFNPQSVASHNRLGASQVGSATYFCAGQYQLMISSLKPFIHISGFNSTPPDISIINCR